MKPGSPPGPKVETGGLSVCPDCFSAHLGRCGGLSYRERLLSIRLDSSATPSRTRRKYYDRQSLDEMFGNSEGERIDQYREDTKGRGAVRLKDATPDDIDFFTGADTERDADDAE